MMFQKQFYKYLSVVQLRAGSSVVECYFGIVEAVGSNPAQSISFLKFRSEHLKTLKVKLIFLQQIGTIHKAI